MRFFVIMAAVVPCFAFSCEEKESIVPNIETGFHMGYTHASIINIWQCSKCGTVNSGFDMHCSSCGSHRNGEDEGQDEEDVE